MPEYAGKICCINVDFTNKTYNALFPSISNSHIHLFPIILIPQYPASPDTYLRSLIVWKISMVHSHR